MTQETLDDKRVETFSKKLVYRKKTIRSRIIASSYAKTFIDCLDVRWAGAASFAAYAVWCQLKSLVTKVLGIYGSLAATNYLVFKRFFCPLRLYSLAPRSTTIAFLKSRAIPSSSPSSYPVDKVILTAVEKIARGELESAAKTLLQYEQHNVVQPMLSDKTRFRFLNNANYRARYIL